MGLGYIRQFFNPELNHPSLSPFFPVSLPSCQVSIRRRGINELLRKAAGERPCKSYKTIGTGLRTHMRVRVRLITPTSRRVVISSTPTFYIFKQK